MWKLLKRWVATLRTPMHGSLGERGELLAERALRAAGLRIVGRRVRTPWGEIDLVAKEGRTWVFVEVKTRRATEMREPLEAVTPAKQRQLTKLAVAYLGRRHQLEAPARFDVVGVLWPEEDGTPEVRHVVNAFESQGHEGMFS